MGIRCPSDGHPMGRPKRSKRLSGSTLGRAIRPRPLEFQKGQEASQNSSWSSPAAICLLRLSRILITTAPVGGLFCTLSACGATGAPQAHYGGFCTMSKARSVSPRPSTMSKARSVRPRPSGVSKARPATASPELLQAQYLQWMRMRNFTPRTIETWGANLARFNQWREERGIECLSEMTDQLLAAYQRWLFHYRTPKPTGRSNSPPRPLT